GEGGAREGRVNRTAVVLALAALAACRHKHWIDVHATELHVNGLVAPIPEGWRDAHELTEPVQAAAVRGTRMLILDRDDAVAEIDVIPLSVPITGDRCAEVAKQWSEMADRNDTALSGAEAATFAGDPGCIMRLTVQGLRGQLAIRTHAGHTVIVRSLHGPQPLRTDFNVDAETEYAFYKVLDGLRSTNASR
ncbi:MAG: hypothetical protein ACM31C_24635, partial [Acidobacteriota bacterium]